MSPSRAPSRGYRPPRQRREVLLAVLASAVVLAVAVALIWALAPHEDVPPSTDSSPITLPTTPIPSTPSTTASTIPG